MTEVIRYLDSKGVKYTASGGEVVIQCPNCNKEKLYINLDSQLFHCFHCEAEEPDSPFAKGHLSSLKELSGDIMPISKVATNPIIENADFTDIVNRYNYELLRNKSALRYLLKRGINEESITRFKLGYTSMWGQEWIAIPSFENDIAKLVKYRKLPPDTLPDMEKYVREKNSKSILFNGDVILKHKSIIICEGELDAITLIQNGFENVIGTTVGAGTLKPEWYDLLTLKEKIFTVFDADKAGQKAVKNVWASRLGVNKVWNVILPDGYDTNSFFLSKTKDDFVKLLNSASRFKVDGVVSIEDALVQLYDDYVNKVQAYSTPFPSLNRLLPGGGLQRSHLFTIGAPGGTGKTSIALQICHHITKEYEIPSLIICLEMPAKDLAVKIVQLDRDLTYSEIDPIDGLIYAQELAELDMYFSYSSHLDVKMLYETIKVCRDRFGIGLVVLDNLQLMVRSQEHMDYAIVSQRAKQLAMELDMIFLMISQPPKLTGRKMTSDDLKGTSALQQDSDEVLILNRPRVSMDENNEIFNPIADCLLDKSRYGRAASFKLNFIGNKSRFEEIIDEPT